MKKPKEVLLTGTVYSLETKKCFLGITRFYFLTLKCSAKGTKDTFYKVSITRDVYLLFDEGETRCLCCKKDPIDGVYELI